MPETREIVKLVVAMTLAGVGLAQGGVQWQPLHPPTSPPARRGHAMVFDALRDRVVLFGGNGQSGSWSPQPVADTWEWDGAGWRRQWPAASPPARWRHAMAWDEVHQQVVLFGGEDAVANEFGDTWVWNGVAWSQPAPVMAPSPRSGHAMAFDAARQRVLLFGGGDPLAPLGDTWVWDGLSWTQVATTTAPPARTHHAMAYDAARQQVVLFGGELNFADTWIWDGAWRLSPGSGNDPPQRSHHSMTWDASRQRVLLFGGRHGGLFSFEDTYEWDGMTWQYLTQAGPSARHETAISFDPAHQRVLLFGGSDGGTWSRLDTWACISANPAGFTSYGTGCAGSLGDLTLGLAQGSAAWLGDPVGIVVGRLPVGALPFLALGFRAVSSPLPWPGCTQWTSAEMAVALTPVGDSASWLQPVPANLALIGRAIFVQGVGLNAGGANALGAAASPGGSVTIGMR